MPGDVIVVVEEAEELDAIGARQSRRLPFEAVPFGPVPDDAEGRVVIGPDPVEGVEQQRDVLVRDQSTGEHHVVRLVSLRRRRAADLLDVDPVGDHLDVVPRRTDPGEAVGGDAGDGDRILRETGGDALDELATGREPAQVPVPVGAPHLVPRRHDRCVGAETRQFARENREVREDGHDENVVRLPRHPRAERRDESNAEVDGFGDRAPVPRVEFRFGGDRTEGHALVGRLGRAVPEVASVHRDVVSLRGESRPEFVDPLLGPPLTNG